MRKSAKKLIAGLLAALMVLTMLPFTAFAASYNIGDEVDPADYTPLGSVEPKIEIVWTAYTGSGKTFILNGDQAWTDAAKNSGTPMDLSEVSVEGLTADQLPEEAQGPDGVGYVCATFLLKDYGDVYACCEIKFGWDDDALLLGSRSRAGFSAGKVFQKPILEDSKFTMQDEPVFLDYASVINDNDNMIDIEGNEHANTCYLAKGLPATSLCRYTGGNAFTFEKIGPNNGDEYCGVTIDGLYLGTLGFQIQPGVTISDHLIKFAPDGDLNRFTVVKYQLENSYSSSGLRYASGEQPCGKMEVVYTEDQETPANEYTVTYKNAEGSEISTEKVTEGNTPAAVPELPANDYDTENHYSYSWDGDTTAPITGDTTFQVVKNATPHQYTSKVIQEATYTQPEITRYTCDCGYSYEVETAPALSHEHNYGTPVADYTSDLPYDEGTSYTHTATCTAEGPCDAQTVKSDCTFDAGTVTQKATVDQPEITTYTCTVCGGTYTKETAPALKGYDVTVKGTDMGTVTLNDDAVVGDSLTKKFAVNDSVTLTANASDTCEFVGWQVGNKIVSTSATYTTIVNAPITYTPVFVDKSEALEFVFLDMFGNVISSQSVSDASEVVMPNDPVYNGYKFTGWSVDADTIHAAQESMTITAQFEKDTDANYTVNAEGATISYGDVSAENTLADVPYGTQVTVTKEGATGWQINGADVAYGDSYTFYVASDVTVAPIDTAVTAKPVVAAVSYSQLDNSHKVEFVASRAMTDDCTLVKAGWVYGKNLTDDDLTLDKVGQVGTGTDSGVVKAAYVSSTEGSTQFILSYGITAQTGTASAKAFITYRDAEGAIQTVYSDAMNYTYGA